MFTWFHWRVVAALLIKNIKQKNLYEKQVQRKSQIHVSILINHNKVKVYTLSTFLDKPVSKNNQPHQLNVLEGMFLTGSQLHQTSQTTWENKVPALTHSAADEASG